MRSLESIIKRLIKKDTKRVVFCFHTHDHEINFGIGFLSSLLKKNGIPTELVIYRETEKVKDRPEEVVSRILNKEPDIIAFSVMTFNWHKVRRLITLVRKEFKGLVVVGGYHTILSPEEVLTFPGVDVICPGEGEEPLLSLVKQYKNRGNMNVSGIDGLIFKEEEGSHISLRNRWLNERLEDYPYIDYELFDSEGNAGLREKHLGMISPSGLFSIPLITGRGCPYKCTYCSNSSLLDFYGGARRYVRHYRVDFEVEQIKKIIKRYKPDFLEFFDETFTLSKKRTLQFCHRYRDEVGVPFLIMSRIDHMDEETVSTLAESGLKIVLFGLESGDEDYRVNYLNRRMANRAIIKGAELLKKYNIMIVTLNMFGMPFETMETVRKTISLNEEIQPDVAIPFIYQPFPNTRLGNLAYEHNLAPPPPEDRWDYLSPPLNNPELPASYVVEVTDEFRERFATHNIQKAYERLRKIANKSSCINV